VLRGLATTLDHQVRLAVTLAWVGGFTNVVGIMACGETISHVTGSATRVSMDVGLRDFEALEMPAWILAWFALGAVVSGLMTGIANMRGWHAVHARPLAIEAVALGSPTAPDRSTAIRSLAASARAHPASWELALRLQIAVVARAAWAMGRGVRPLFSFSEGRTFRTAIQLQRRCEPRQERELGLLAHCHGCGEQLHQSLLQLRRWPACPCGEAAPPLTISGPLWLGPLQHAPTLRAMQELAAALPAGRVDRASERLLERLLADPGQPPRCWPTAELGRRLGGGPPATEALLTALRAEGFVALRSGVMNGQFRCNAPWQRVLELAAALNR